MKALINQIRQLTLTDLVGYILYTFLFLLLALVVSKWFYIGVVAQVFRFIIDLLSRSLNKQIERLND